MSYESNRKWYEKDGIIKWCGHPPTHNYFVACNRALWATVGGSFALVMAVAAIIALLWLLGIFISAIIILFVATWNALATFAGLLDWMLANPIGVVITISILLVGGLTLVAHRYNNKD